MAFKTKVFTTRIAYYQNGNEKTEDGMIGPNEIFRIRQITMAKEAKYTWKIEKLDSWNNWDEFIQDGVWYKNEIEGGEPNFKDAQKFVAENYPNAIAVQRLNKTFTFFGEEAKLLSINERIENVIKCHFAENDVKIFEKIAE
jgi:hypothetical protein